MTKAIKASSRLDDTASSQPVDDAVADTSRRVLAWIEAAAAADNERRFFHPGALIQSGGVVAEPACFFFWHDEYERQKMRGWKTDVGRLPTIVVATLLVCHCCTII